MKNKIIYILLGVTIIGLVVLFFLKQNEKKKKLKEQTPVNNLTQTGNNGGGASNEPTQQTPVYATPGINPYPAQPNGVNQSVLIKMVQAALNLKVDGILGVKTKAAMVANNIDINSPQKFTDKMISVNEADYKKYFPLKKGSKNNYVKAVQVFLGIKADGIFGSGTEKAVLAATGTNIIYHKQYTELFTKSSGVAVSYNNKEIINPLAKLALKAANPIFGLFL